MYNNETNQGPVQYRHASIKNWPCMSRGKIYFIVQCAPPKGLS